MNLLPLFQWIESTPIALAFQKSDYLFPLVEVVHLFGITLLLAGALIVNLRLLGLPILKRSPSEAAAALSPLFWIGFWIAVGTGVPLFMSEATKCLYNPAFAPKILLLVLATVVQLTLSRKVAFSSRPGSAVARATAIVSLVLWFGVAIAGRAIGFL